MDEIDKKILNALQKNAKLNMKELADELNISRSPLYERVKRLEEKGYISHYSAILNKIKIGNPLTVFCKIGIQMCDHENYTRIIQELLKLDEVTECYSVAGDYELFIKVIVKDIEAYEHFRFEKLTTLSGLAKMDSQVMIHEFKSSTFIKL